METLLWIVVGGALGWLSRRYFALNEDRGAVGAALIGAAGAMLGGKALAPLFLAPALPAGGIGALPLLFAAAAAIACLVLGEMVQRRWGV